MEDHASPPRFQALHHDGRTGERRVAAQRHLDGRGEPPQSIIAFERDEKCSLGQIVFRGDRLHRRVWREFAERHHGRGIPGEALRRKRVKLKEWGSHLNFQSNV